MSFAHVFALRPGEVSLSFSREAAFHQATVTGSGRPNVERALSDHFGRPTRLALKNGADPGETGFCLADEEQQDRTAREKSLEAKVHAHPAVRAALRVLGGQVEQVLAIDRGSVPTEEPQAPEEGPDDGA